MARKADLIIFQSPEAMADRLADLVATTLERSIAAQGLTSIALSGGSTPTGLYRNLSRRDIDWTNVSATLVDERFVPPTADASNEKLVRETFLQEHARTTRFVGFWNDAATLDTAATTATGRIAGFIRPFDVVILGMGGDGHVASWFPRADGLKAALADDAPAVVPVIAEKTAVTAEQVHRLTLSLRAIRDARLICLLMIGEEKRAAMTRALAAGPVEDYPVRAILNARPDLWACWSPESS